MKSHLAAAALACSLVTLLPDISAAGSGPPSRREIDAYYNGKLVRASIQQLPDGASAGLGRNNRLGALFVGSLWLCTPWGEDGVVACFLTHVTPVIETVDGGPVLRGVEVFARGDRAWTDFTSYSEIEDAVRAGDARVYSVPAVYRLTLFDSEGSAATSDGAFRGREVRSKDEPAPDESASWGRVKGLFR